MTSIIYTNYKILGSQFVCESGSRCIILNDGMIDSIVTRSSLELNTESPFTFVYLHSGKCIEKVGECIYHSKKTKSQLCILEPPCCAGNVFVYHWLKYDLYQDTIKQVCEVAVYTTTKIYSKDIFWHAYPKQKKIPSLLLRSEPVVNDTEEDEELRQVGNVIYNETCSHTLLYELGYSKKQPLWRICALQKAGNNFLIGWYRNNKYSRMGTYDEN